MANTSAPLAVSVTPDPLVLERVVTSRRLGTYAIGADNGFNSDFSHDGGNGQNGGNGHSNTDGLSGAHLQPPAFTSPLSAAMGGITGAGPSVFGRAPGSPQSFASWGDDEAGTAPISSGAPAGEEPSSAAPAVEPQVQTSYDPVTTPQSASLFEPAPEPASAHTDSSFEPASPLAPPAPPPVSANLAPTVSEMLPEPSGNQPPQNNIELSETFIPVIPALAAIVSDTGSSMAADDDDLDKIGPSDESPSDAPPESPAESQSQSALASPSESQPESQPENDASSPPAAEETGAADTTNGAADDIAGAVTGAAAGVVAGAVAGAAAGLAAAAVYASMQQPENNDAQTDSGHSAQAAQTPAEPPPAPEQEPVPQAAQKEPQSHFTPQQDDFFSMGPDALRNSSARSKSAAQTDSQAFPSDCQSPSQNANDSFFNATANDFFSAAPIPKPKMEGGTGQPLNETSSEPSSKPDDDHLFPDESHLRGTKEPQADTARDERPKVARPKGYEPRAEDQDKDLDKVKLKETSVQDSNDEADDEEEDKAALAPARRSFSSKGGTTTNKSRGAAAKAAAKSSDEEEGKDKEDNRDSDEDEAPVGFLDQEVNLLGLSLTRKTAGILAAVFLTISIIVFNTFCTIFTTLAGNFSNVGNHAAKLVPAEMQGVPDISGLYELRYNTELDRRGGAWQLEIQQNGNQFFARGEDNGGPWAIQGKIAPPDKFGFEKFYIKNGKAAGKPLIYYGRYWLDELHRPSMSGQLQFDVHKGVFLHSKWVTIKGKFQMRQIISGAVLAANRSGQQQVAVGQAPAAQSKSGGFNPLTLLHPDNQAAPKRPGDMSGFFMNVAGVLIAIGVGIAILFLWIFGPSGKINILAKQQYIPSQYQAQHNKMVREWAGRLQPGGVPLGHRVEWRIWKPWQTKTLSMPPQARTVNPHILVMGGSDKGKTRFVANMITHDIESADRAVVVIDSDGELTDVLIRWVASHPKGKEYARRISVIDPTYRGGSLSYNPLEVPDDGNMIDAASAIVHGFKAIYTEPPGSQSQWNQQTANILRNAAILLMVNNRTLTDLPTLLQDNDFRDILLEGVEKRKRERAEFATLLETWGQYKRLARTDQWITWSEPILNRVTPMLSDPRIRPILTKPVGDLRLRGLIKNKQILFVRIPQGQLDQNANLLGSLVVTGLKQAALSLADSSSSSKTRPVALYLDELNNFIEKETIEALTQETTKFQIGFVGCCKTLQHLPEDFRNNMVINMGTICAFALAKKDGDMLGPQMFRVDGRKIKHQTIQNFFNKVNTSPQFELIADEEKLNIDRVVGQEERHYFCYKVGTVAGTFCLKTHDFPDINDNKVSAKLVEQMHKGAQEPAESPRKKKSA